ncbi:MAG: rnhB [Gammaproteobacteria bacterium]|jgi:ribonuclease HII|nr:rnhB [Gammaproteobacteria bacterium]
MKKNNEINQLVVGIDEAGRGPLAGPVYAAAVILNPEKPIEGLADSKLLSAQKRRLLFGIIQKNALAWAVGRAEVAEIDRINILQATFLAMQRAFAALHIIPQCALIDGNVGPLLPCPVQMKINGDKTEPEISAASIVAKFLRDEEMNRLDQQFPQYGFAKHKGYGTSQHMAALTEHGPILNIHRNSFAPIAKFKGQYTKIYVGKHLFV